MALAAIAFAGRGSARSLGPLSPAKWVLSPGFWGLLSPVLPLLWVHGTGPRLLSQVPAHNPTLLALMKAQWVPLGDLGAGEAGKVGGVVGVGVPYPVFGALGCAGASASLCHVQEQIP